MLDVLMHQPDRPIRSFVDSLQAFWPGLQVCVSLEFRTVLIDKVSCKKNPQGFLFLVRKPSNPQFY